MRRVDGAGRNRTTIVRQEVGEGQASYSYAWRASNSRRVIDERRALCGFDLRFKLIAPT